MTLMARLIAFIARRRCSGTVGLPLLVVTFIGVTANAGATLRIENHNHPAGDPAAITYFLENPNWSLSPFEFVLRDGESRSFGQPAGTYTARAALPAGWKVIDIICIGPNPDNFIIDVPNARVTMIHGPHDEQTCSFTNGKADGSGPSSGVSPSPPAAELPDVKVPNEPALLGVRVRRGSAAVRLRIIRRSVITVHIRRGTRILARKRVVRRAGTRVVRIRLRPETRRWLRTHGRKRVTVTLKVKIADRRGTAKVFWYKAIIPV
jgi:hypothetical protein